MRQALPLDSVKKTDFMKNNNHRFPVLGLTVAVMLATLNAPAQLTLGIAPSGNHAVLSWPATATNCVLQSATNLAAPNWLAVSNIVPVISNNNYTVPVTNTMRAVFYRLRGTNSSVVPAGMVLIPGGSFTIGDTLDGDTDAAPTNVWVSAFYMDTNLVSYGLWQSVYNWATNHGYVFDDPEAATGKGPNYPVTGPYWDDCVKWCNARSEKEGRTPAYYTNAAQQAVYRTGGFSLDNFCVKRSGAYRLPTEAEWEKAARGGLAGKRFPWGDTINEGQADYYGSPPGALSYDTGPYGPNAIGSMGATSFYGPFQCPVGLFPTNGYGLYDMAGNATECCWDYYVPSLDAATGSPYLGGKDPCGPNWDGGLGKVLRGGDGYLSASFARCACRFTDADFGQNDIFLGFGRCVIGPSGFGEAFFDGFSTGLNSTNWSVSQTTANLYSVNASQGRLQLAKIAHNPGGTQNVSVLLKLAALGGPITNDFSLQIDFTNAVLPGPGLDQVELRTFYQDGSIFIAGYEYNGGITAYTSWDGTVQFPVSETGNSGTFRVCRTASQIFALFNGRALWGQGNTASSLTNVTLVLQNSSGSDDATSVSFDNFSLTSPTLPAH